MIFHPAEQISKQYSVLKKWNIIQEYSMHIKKKISECLFFSLGLSKENIDTLRGKKDNSTDRYKNRGRCD